MPIHDDITTYKGRDCDVITGGFPCQDVSVAGRRAGITAERSGLWTELCRLIGDIRPRYAVVENVTGLLAGPTERPGGWFGRVLGDLAEIGFDAEWEVLPASAFGAFHCRQRVWIVAYPNDDGVRPQRVWPKASRAWDEQQFSGLVQDTLRTCVPTGNLGGISDGVPNRLHKLRGLGNAIVPQVAYQIFEAINETVL